MHCAQSHPWGSPCWYHVMSAPCHECPVMSARRGQGPGKSPPRQSLEHPPGTATCTHPRSQFHGERGHFYRLRMSAKSRKRGVFFNRIREFKKRGKFLPGRVRLPVGNTDLRLLLIGIMAAPHRKWLGP